MIDERSPIPLYYQLREVVRARIEGGLWQPGEQLPPEVELCQEFNLSRGTVRQALADLVREGLLQRRRGKGSFVASPKIPQNISSGIMGIAGSLACYARQVTGYPLGTRVISVGIVPAGRSLAEKLAIPEGSEVIEIRKVKLAQAHPYFLANNYLPRVEYPGLEQEDHSAGSIFELLQQKYRIRVTRVEGWFEPVLISEYEASELGVEKGSPAMLYERIRYTTGDRPFVLSRHVIRGDMCRITFQLGDSSGF
ncbi:MAG: GntR family transcriptional regulator [Chloroflexota bacterium]